MLVRTVEFDELPQIIIRCTLFVIVSLCSRSGSVELMTEAGADPSRKVSEQCLISTIEKKSVKNLIQIIRKILKIYLNMICSRGSSRGSK